MSETGCAKLKGLTVALDWTPNTNHTGFYVAKAKGWYEEAGLSVRLISPHVDDYKTTPAARVASKQAQFAVAPSETVISHHTQPAGSDKPRLQAIASLLADDNSAVVTLQDSGLDRPSKLDGKVYGSYGARYEGRIVQEIIRADGGQGIFQETTPPMLGIWNTLLAGKADATWIFMGWEGVQAQRQGVKLNVFKPRAYGIAYGPSPVLVADPAFLDLQTQPCSKVFRSVRGPQRPYCSEDPDVIRRFLVATGRGYKHAAACPEESADILTDLATRENPDLPEPLDCDFVRASQQVVSQYILDAKGKWSVMRVEQWDAFLDWLSVKGLLTTKVASRQPHGEHSSTLDGLRSGDAGEPVARESISANDLFRSYDLRGSCGRPAG